MKAFQPYRASFFVVFSLAAFAVSECAAEMRIPFDFGHRAAVGSVYGLSRSVRYFGFSRDSRFYAIAQDRPSVELWDLSTLEKSFELEAPNGGGEKSTHMGFHFSTDGSTLALYVRAGGVRAEENEITLFDLARCERRAGIPLGRNRFWYAAAFSPDGSAAALQVSEPTVRSRKSSKVKRAIQCELIVCDATSGRLLKRLDTGSRYGDVAFSTDGKWLAAVHGVSDDKGQVLMWDAATLEPHCTVRMGGGWLTLAFSPDSKLLAVGVNRNNSRMGRNAGPAPHVLLLDVVSRRKQGALEGYNGGSANSYALAFPTFAPHGGLLLASCYSAPPCDTLIKRWDLVSGEQTVLEDVAPEVQASGQRWEGVALAAFSRDGSLVATPISNPARIQLWETKYWRPLRTIPLRNSGRDPMPLAYTRDIEFSPDGQWLAAVGELPQRGKGEAVIFRVSDLVDIKSLGAEP